jgi:hypothetical protein
MSVDHTFEIGCDDHCKVLLNISGVNKGGHDLDIISANLYAFDRAIGVSKFTCSLSLDRLGALYRHLDRYSMVRAVEPITTGKFVEITGNMEDVLSVLATANSEALVPALKNIILSRLTTDDVNTILGRKESLATFECMLGNSQSLTEPEWQQFFEANEWIFGYGLKYRYLKILQREAHVSRTDLSGANDVISDFLLSDARFTKLVELKTPDTDLFKSRRNRADSWCLSSDLTDAVSQILAQKANWELEGAGVNYTANGTKISEAAHDVECILIIGRHSDIDGSDREIAMKAKTLELYRRNLRNIDIILFDELFERAKYIVDGQQV